uniref:olfactomedin-4-like n=1 Tax=Oncorhynchus gorbuscha TaxID=8017 RepID=UPI001EAF00BC|nr:olfactomedin-4-like [Oncorhynchus gorbuscha]
MTSTLFVLALLRTTLAFGPVGPWSESNGTEDGGGKCSCEAFLPGSTFPVGELVLLEEMAMQINHKLEMEMSKISSMVVVVTKLERYNKNLVLVTRREYINIQLKLEECEKRHNEIFNPNIGS